MVSLECMSMCEHRSNCDGCFYRESCFWREVFYFECYKSLKSDSLKVDLGKKSNQKHIDIVKKFYNSLDSKKSHELKKHPSYSEK